MRHGKGVLDLIARGNDLCGTSAQDLRAHFRSTILGFSTVIAWFPRGKRIVCSGYPRYRVGTRIVDHIEHDAAMRIMLAGSRRRER